MSSHDETEANGLALLSPAEMATVDRLTVASGTPVRVLMERAGQAVASAVGEAFPGARRIAVLAGPGNNGGDAFVAARLLAEAGAEMSVFVLPSQRPATDDAALAASAYPGRTLPIDACEPERFDLLLDGLFGAGLARPVEEGVAALMRRTAASGVPVVSIDLPSGVSGLSGAVLGESFQARLTVTFFRRKPGHLLTPGRMRCGRVVVADIGMSADTLDAIRPRLRVNAPGLWRKSLTPPASDGHKYDRGHAVVFSGGASRTGAARLAAMAALRAGAGLVTVFSPGSAMLVNAAHLTAIMLRRCETAADLADALGDERLSVFVLGPGFGDGEQAREHADAILCARRALVLDADGLTAFEATPSTLFDRIAATGAEVVLTPHGGELRRLFPDLAADDGLSKPEKALAAAGRSGATLILKGADTVIAAPDGRAAINETGTPWLATAGSGDVLAGMVAGCLARKMPPFDAAAAAVWLHGRAAEAFGPGLIAEDLAGQLPSLFRDLERGNRS